MSSTVFRNHSVDGRNHNVDDTGGRTLAVATVGRDRLSLEAEAAMERGDRAALDAMPGARTSGGGTYRHA